MNRRTFLGTTAGGLAAMQLGQAWAQTVASPLRVAIVTPGEAQPQQGDLSVITYNDFSQPPAEGPAFLEYVSENGSFVWKEGEGMRGGAMRCHFAKGQVSAGRLHVLFGKNPLGKGLRRDETFREIYWRVYVKHEAGWEGNPAKLARATCLAGRDYSQGFIAHVWGGKGDVLCIDPATGIRDNQKVSVRYNDFEHLKWLGLKNAQTPVFSTAESGRWVCIESHIKLNTAGAKDGIFELWVDGKLEASRNDLDWHGTWNEYAINAVFLENYWNQGSVKAQSRWFDNLVISTKPIGPITAEATPKINLTKPLETGSWEAEVAADAEGRNVVWHAKPQAAKNTGLTIDPAHGSFTGSRANQTDLAPGGTHWLRVRAAGQPEWSPWHAPFARPKL